jgi:hypothetical protein
VIVWFALLTVSVIICVAEPDAFIAVSVIGKVPAVVGVPVSVAVPVAIPPVNVTPVGSAPVCVIVGLGPPEAVMLNVAIAVPTVSAGTIFDEVKAGGAMLTGVTMTVVDAALLPCAFVAMTEQVYVFPLVKPVIVRGEAVPVCDAEAGIDPVQVAVYPVIGEPPVLVGGVNEMVVDWKPAEPLMPVGGCGTPAVIVKVLETSVAAA